MPECLHALCLGALLAIALPCQAQETTAHLAGYLMGADGRPIAGGQITIVHVPSGTSASTTCRLDPAASMARTITVDGVRIDF